MKKSLKQKIAIGVTAAVLATPFGMNAVPQTAEAFSLGDVVGAAIGGAAASAQLNQQIKYYNDTDEGRNELFQQMQDQDGLCSDWAINSRIDGIMANLINGIGQVDSSIYDKPFQYFINNQDDFNAYCTLGRNMSINKGVFSLTDNEAEIAVVLGHEMGHGMKDHPAKGAKRSLGPAILAAAAGGSALANLAANLITNNGITKPQEWEADNLSFEYITHTNYNPGATAAIWQRYIDQNGDNNSASDFPSAGSHCQSKIHNLHASDCLSFSVFLFSAPVKRVPEYPHWKSPWKVRVPDHRRSPLFLFRAPPEKAL